MQATAQKVRSKDGTLIACWRSGNGPPLVLVHGGGASDHTRWKPILEFLEEHFTVYAMDRRGRGDSGDAEDYSFEREYEDVVAVVSAIDGPVNVYGVSAGANFALEAAPSIRNLHRLALYEPVLLPPGSQFAPPALIDRIQSMVDNGSPEEAIVTFLRESARMPPQEIDRLRANPTWTARVDAAHTLGRELRVMNEYRFDPARFEGLRVPTLLMVGGDSPPLYKDGVESVHAAITDSRVEVIQGQAHLDIASPELLARTLVSFFSAD